MINSNQVITILLFIGFLILVMVAFFPSYFLKFIGKLISKELTTEYRGLSSIAEDQNPEEDPNHSRIAVGLIHSRK